MGLPGGFFSSIVAAAEAAGDLVTELTSFVKFKERVDELIRDLKGSPAGAGHIGQEALPRHRFGGGEGAWSDASGLFSSYRSVIGDLEDLSRLLSDSMEAMGIAVLASHEGYQNIDVDLRDRIRKIHAETKKNYDDRPPGDQPFGRDPYHQYDKPTGNTPGHGHGDNPPAGHKPPAGGPGSGGSAGGAI